MNAGNFAHALANVGITALNDLVEKFFRNEMSIGVDAHELLRTFVILSIRRNDVEQRLSAIVDDGGAGTRQGIRQVGGFVHALRASAPGPGRSLERGRGVGRGEGDAWTCAGSSRDGAA